MRTSHGFQFALRTGASALAMTLALAGAAHAQTAPVAEPQADEDASQVDEIVVTGFRASLASAVSAKRRESGIVDVIKAEDIADFPDLNLAESLQRIPGVTITRANGEGRQISVRGLGSEYTRVRVNGMEAIATTGGTANSGGTNRSRGFDFNMFASELFNSLTVRKSASADVEEGSLGATVDLQTARPFDYREPTLVLGVQGSYNDLARDVQPRVTLLASRTWMDGKFGALFSAAYEKRHILEEGANITRWSHGGSNGATGGFNAASTLPGYTAAQINGTLANPGLYHPRIPSYVSYDINSERLGLTGALQFRPDEKTLFTLDVLYSDVKTTRDEAQLQAIGFSRPQATGRPEIIIRSGVVDGRNIVAGVFDNVDLRAQAAHDELETQFQQYTFTATRNWTERFRTGFVGGYSRSEFTNPVSTIITFDRANTQGYAYDFRTRAPAITLGFDPTQAANWSMNNGVSEVRIRPSAVTNAFTTAKGYFEFDANEQITLKGGLDYRRFTFDSSGQTRTTETVVQTLTPAQLAAVSTTYSGFGRNFDMPSGNATSWLIPDINKFVAAYNIYSNTGIYAISDQTTGARGQNFNVQENDTGAYLQADFRFDAFGIPFRGDAGVRYVLTEQFSNGFASTGGQIQLVSARRDYDTVLPSANLAADITDNVVARISAAQTISRPSIGSLTPGGDVGIQGGNFTFSSGNPNVLPTKSNNVDFSLEYYPDSDSLFSVGLFYKKFDTFVQTLSQNIPFSSLGLPSSLLVGAGLNGTDLPASTIFRTTQPINTDGGTLKGFEINAQKRLSFLPGWMENFGVQANYTFVSSDIEYLTSTVPGAPTINETLVGLSKNAANGTLYYETEKFSIRGSVAYRQGYLTQVPGNDGNTVQGTNETINFDAQASYQITPQLKASVEGINLTDEYNDQYVDASNRLNVLTHTGRQFFVGLRYTF